MSGTPETDDIARGNHVVPVEWAEKLERERDDAREKAERYRIEANAIMMQRDDAREKYATEATEHMLAVNKLCGERDEARDALMKIEDLFIDCTDIYEDFKNMGMIAKAALEETK